MKTIVSSVAKCLRSFRYAFNGIAFAMRTENNFIYHILATLAIITTGIILRFTLTEWYIIIILIGLVYAAEIVNSAIEKLVDLAAPRYHYKAGLIKDMSAGGVLVISIAAFIIGLLIIVNHL